MHSPVPKYTARSRHPTEEGACSDGSYRTRRCVRLFAAAYGYQTAICAMRGADALSATPRERTRSSTVEITGIVDAAAHRPGCIGIYRVGAQERQDPAGVGEYGLPSVLKTPDGRSSYRVGICRLRSVV